MTGSGEGVVLISPDHKLYPFSYKIQFSNTNNTVEYNALLIGLVVEREMGIKNLYVWGDAKMIVIQVWGNFQVKNQRLKHYQNLVWDSIEFLDEFSINVVPRESNSREDALVVYGSFLIPHLNSTQDKFIVDMIFRPSVIENTDNW